MFIDLYEAYIPNLGHLLCLEPFKKFLVGVGGGGGRGLSLSLDQAEQKLENGGKSFRNGGGAIVLSKNFFKTLLGLDIIISQSVNTFSKF